MTPPLREVAATHQRFLSEIASLTDAQIGESSRLPGWSRGHVLGHLTDAARARARVIEHALREEEVAMWGPGERDEIIEATAGRTAEQHRAAFAQAASQLELAWDAVENWDNYETTVFTRWRELWIHLVDLDIGVEHTAWDNGLTSHVIDLFSQRLPEGFSVYATDLDRSWGVGTVIAGTGTDLAAWLTGRDSAVTGPELGSWPTY